MWIDLANLELRLKQRLEVKWVKTPVYVADVGLAVWVIYQIVVMHKYPNGTKYTSSMQCVSKQAKIIFQRQRFHHWSLGSLYYFAAIDASPLRVLQLSLSTLLRSRLNPFSKKRRHLAPLLRALFTHSILCSCKYFSVSARFQNRISAHSGIFSFKHPIYKCARD